MEAWREELHEDLYLEHHGIKGQRWGIRRYQNPDGSLTEAGKKRYGGKGTVFVSGSSKTQEENSPYRRDTLPKDVQKELDDIISSGKRVIVGDAPGIDRQVQDYLASKKYADVEVYGPGHDNVRYTANKSWKTNVIDAPDYEPGSPEWLAAKDIVMSKYATEGLAVVLDSGAKATRNNVRRLLADGKPVKIYELNVDGSDQDRWIYEIDDEIKHHGIKDQKWGVRRYQNEDGSLTELGREHYGISKKDTKWATKNRKKITNAAYNASKRELNEYATELLRQPGAKNANGRLSAATINAYNRRMAELMSQKVSELRSPDDRVINFVAKRGEIGVHMALSDAGYDISQLRNGIWENGRIAYRKKVVDRVEG